MSRVLPRLDNLPAHMRVADAAEPIARLVCEHIERSWQKVLQSAASEGPHELRIGLRKLRVVLRTFRDNQQSPPSDLTSSIVVTSRLVGHLRDIDVLIDDLIRPLVGNGLPDGSERLIELLTQDRDKVRTKVHLGLRKKSARMLRASLSNLPAALAARLNEHGGDEKIGKLAKRDLRRRWRKIAAHAVDLEAATPATLHEYRKALKNLRYAYEPFAPFWDSAHASTFNAQLRRIQTSLGYLNDVVTAQSLPARLGAAANDAGIGCSIGFVLGWHSARAQAEHEKIAGHWSDLRATKVARELAD